ncbi:hypothetical protein PS2_036262 [Malus domestica]
MANFLGIFTVKNLLGLSLALNLSLVLKAIYESGKDEAYMANNLPSPSRVAVLLQSLNVSCIKLYDADGDLAGSGLTRQKNGPTRDFSFLDHLENDASGFSGGSLAHHALGDVTASMETSPCIQ